ncbi:hypothetical protein BDP27DRAFT_1422580 [Rhodocollybia butyracea]|uniref:Uncharacterized protein n=1 Tax=Rhodocollybia butyracea TaxID=206335 RepID=A0A9P5PTB9_9AGAR|nr:hypothetical protein BDP27DRAFT_1422580 [Rhodocollybia butyracea]
MWTSLYFVLPSADKAYSESSSTPFPIHDSMIAIWLNRSCLPVDIRVETIKKRSSCSDVTADIVQAIIDIPFCHRIRSLKLVGSLDSMLPTILALPSGLFPIIIKLALRILVSISAEWTENQKILSFADSPLTKLDFKSERLWMQGTTINNHFRGLDTFSIETASLTSLKLGDDYSLLPVHTWNMLQRCDALVELTLNAGRVPLSLMVSVTLPYLTKLTLLNPSESDEFQMGPSSLLTAPALTELILDFSRISYGWTKSLAFRFAEFQTRSSCTLTRLSILHANTLPNKDLLFIIDVLNLSLQSLTVIGDKISSKTLLQKVKKRICLPNLSSLHFAWSRPSLALNEHFPRLILDVLEPGCSRSNVPLKIQVNTHLKVVKMWSKSAEEHRSHRSVLVLDRNDQKRLERLKSNKFEFVVNSSYK